MKCYKRVTGDYLVYLSVSVNHRFHTARVEYDGRVDTQGCCMHRFLAIISVIFLLVGCGSSLKTPVRSPDGVHQHMGNSTVALVFYDADDKEYRPFCTGVWLNQTDILTAGHCAEAIARHEKKLDDTDPVDPVDVGVHYIVSTEVPGLKDEEPAAVHFAHVKAWDEDHDLALIRAAEASIPDHDSASFASSMPGLGERIFVVGHPRGLYWSYVEGVVSAYREREDIGMVVQVSAPVWFGNSGGGVFDTSGNLIGVASRLARAPNTAFFIHQDSVKKFLHDLKDREEKHAEQKALREEKK